MIGMAGMAAGATAIGATALPGRQNAQTGPEPEAPFQLIEHLIINTAATVAAAPFQRKTARSSATNVGRRSTCLSRKSLSSAWRKP